MRRVESVREGIAPSLSLAAGAIILAGTIVFLLWMPVVEMGWMMGRMMGMQPLQIYNISIVQIISGIMIILGGIIMYARPYEQQRWGILVLIFSALSLIWMGGFVIGPVLGIIGGSLAISKYK